MPSKRGVIVLLVAVALIIGAAIVMTSGSDSGNYRSYKTDAPAGLRLARQACETLSDFVALAKRNGSSATGMSLLKRFEADASAAYDKDVKWTRLMSAAQSLRAGFKADDPASTRVGYDVAREECRRV